MADWYYLKNGEQKGPVPTEFISSLAQSGQLQRTDLVWTEGMKDWLPAESAPGLSFPGAVSQPGSTIPPGLPPQAVSNYLVWSILSTVFCCLPGGIVAIIYSCKVNTAIELGNYVMAQEASKKAKMWNIISLCVGLVTTLVYGLIMLIPTIMGLSQGIPKFQ